MAASLAPFIDSALWIPKSRSGLKMQVFSVREIIIVSTMTPFFIAFLALVASTFRTRAAQQAEILALRHQIAVLQQSAPRRLRLRQSDRLLWICLSRFWPGWRRWLRILKPDTVLRWERSAFAPIGSVNRAA